MRKLFLPTTLPVLVAALLLAGAPRTVHAQQQSMQQCTATAAPEQVAAGQLATRVRFTLSEKAGAITSIKTSEDSGITLASPKDLPRQEMANPNEAPKPIEMSSENPNVAVLWLNTKGASQGTQQLTLVGQDQSCTAHLAITSGGSH